MLIFGGTGFLGPHFVEALRAGGHQITLFNRGKSNPGLFKDLETLIGDRDGKLDALKGRDWDVVIDDSGYVPRIVKLSADLLKDHVRHYIFVSSISVYGTFPKPGLDEDDKVAEPPDPKIEEVNGRNLCGPEGRLRASHREHLRIPLHDRAAALSWSDPATAPIDSRIGPVRVARGGQVLAPGSANDPLQFIDVRDLAAFMRRCAEVRPPGRFNACSPPGVHTMGEVLETSKRVSGSNATFVWADAGFIQKNGLMEKGEIPSGFRRAARAPPQCSSARRAPSSKACASAISTTTVRDTLDWYNKRPAEHQQKLAVGLTPEREAELLKQLTATKG